MKIKSIRVEDFPPIKKLDIENLGEIVIIAGANGSGKTRLKQSIVETLQGNPRINLEITSTRQEEVEYFSGEELKIIKGQPNQVLNNYINSRHFGRGKYVGSLVQIDSQRNIQTVNYAAVNWLGNDPDDQDTPGNYYFSGFSDRWQEFMNYIHQKSAIRDKKLAEELKKNPSDGINIIKNNPDPLDKYKLIFTQLLPGKKLQDINPASPGEFHYQTESGEILPFRTLSSGEQEVVKVIFDVERKDIRHSIIIVDEPELHLHPTLTFKLIETLKTIGESTNQYIFLTHSADLISTYYSTGYVYFIDSNQSGANQANKLSELGHTHSALVQLIGENLGMFAVGKKLVFVEGEESSIDRLTYHAIAQKFAPEVKVNPVGHVDNITTLANIETQIRNTIFGVELYMIRDRDGLTDDKVEELEINGKLKCLRKRHIENYFLDSEVLCKVAERLCITDIHPEINQDYIDTKLKEIAQSTLNSNLLQGAKEFIRLNRNFDIPTVREVDKKTPDTIKAEIISAVESSFSNLSDNLSKEKLQSWLDDEYQSLVSSLQDGSWTDVFSGKEIFSIFCSTIFDQNQLQVRHAYVELALEIKPEVFDDILSFFQSIK